MNEVQLPESWIVVKLGDVCFTTSGGTPSRKRDDFYNGSIPWVKSGELDKGIIYDTEEHITEAAVKHSSAKIFPKGTLLIALYGATIGKLGFLGVDAATNQAVCGIFENKVVHLNFLKNFLFFNRIKLVEKGAGGAQPNISQTILKDLLVSVPPLAEQHRIVAKIEELFSELDKGVEILKTAQEQLKVYRQAVLKYAFEGKLTNSFRMTFPDANSIQELKKIRKKREEWFIANKKKQKITYDINDEYLPKLPNEWNWIKICETVFNTADDIVDGPFGSNLKNSDYIDDKEVPVISISNIEEGFDKKIRYISQKKFDTIKRSAVYPGDIIVAKIGSTYGKTGLYPKSMPIGVIPANLLRIRPSEHYQKKLLFYYLQSAVFKKRLDGIMKSTAQPAFNVSMFKELPIPFMHIKEQQVLVSEIESRLSVCDKIEESIQQGLQQAEALRQSILKKAFEGKLVPQDPNDEPASVLLERIKAERAFMQPVKNTKTKKAKKLYE